MAAVTAGVDIAGRAAAYGMPAAVVDGNDLWAVTEAAREAVERARAGGGPTLLECRTYRHYGHSKSDPATYRPKAEVEHWLARDPLPRARERLLADGVERGRDRGRRARDRASGSTRAVAAALGGAVPRPARRARDGVRGMSARPRPLEFRARDPRRARRGARARRARRVLRRGRRAARRRLQADAAACASASAPTASSTRRSPSSRSPARRTAPPSPACARSSRSCSATSWRCRWTRSSTRRRSSGTSRTSRGRCRSSCARRSARGGRFGAIHSQIHATWFQGVPGLKIAFPSSPAEAKGLLKGVDPRRQPGHLPRAQAPVLGQGPVAGGRRRRHPARRGERRARGRRPHDRLGRQGRARRAHRRRRARRTTASTPR